MAVKLVFIVFGRVGGGGCWVELAVATTLCLFISVAEGCVEASVDAVCLCLLLD